MIMCTNFCNFGQNLHKIKMCNQKNPQAQNQNTLSKSNVLKISGHRHIHIIFKPLNRNWAKIEVQISHAVRSGRLLVASDFRVLGTYCLPIITHSLCSLNQTGRRRRTRAPF